VMSGTGSALLACALLTAGFPTTADAQVRVVRHADERLTGIREVDVLVRGVGAEADGCEAIRHTVEATAAERLRAGGVRATVSEVAPSWHHSLLITLSSAATPCGCSTALVIDLVAHVRGMPDADAHAAPDAWGSLLVGYMPLSSTTDVVTASAPTHPHAIEQLVRTRVDALAARIKSKNP
jgi:hypothetical protein